MNRTLVLAVIGIAVALLIGIGLLVWFSVAGWWPIVVDVVICVTCALSMLILVMIGGATFYLTVTLLNIKRELVPVLESLKVTSYTVSQTARVASDLGVSPTVRTASTLVGAVETAAVVLGRGRARTRAQRRAQRRIEVERELTARGEYNGTGS